MQFCVKMYMYCIQIWDTILEAPAVSILGVKECPEDGGSKLFQTAIPNSVKFWKTCDNSFGWGIHTDILMRSFFWLKDAIGYSRLVIHVAEGYVNVYTCRHSFGWRICWKYSWDLWTVFQEYWMKWPAWYLWTLFTLMPSGHSHLTVRILKQASSTSAGINRLMFQWCIWRHSLATNM